MLAALCFLHALPDSLPDDRSWLSCYIRWRELLPLMAARFREPVDSAPYEGRASAPLLQDSCLPRQLH